MVNFTPRMGSSKGLKKITQTNMTCSCSSAFSFWGFEQPGLVEDVPAHGREVGTRWSLRSLPTQTILLFDVYSKCTYTINLLPEWSAE